MMITKHMIPVLTILFVGLARSAFASLRGEDKKAAECFKKWAIELYDMKILENFSPEDALWFMGTKMPDDLESDVGKKHRDPFDGSSAKSFITIIEGASSAKLIRDCLGKDLFDKFLEIGAQNLEKEMTETDFAKFYVGLFTKTRKHIDFNGPERLTERFLAIQCLKQYINDGSKYQSDEEFIDQLCGNISVKENTTDGGAAEISIRTCLLEATKGEEKEGGEEYKKISDKAIMIFDHYKQIGQKKIEKNQKDGKNSITAILNFFAFKVGLCSTDSFTPFKKLTGPEKLVTLSNLSSCGETFMNSIKNLHHNDKSEESGESEENFVTECLEKGAYDIKEMTKLGLKKLELCDNIYLNIFLQEQETVRKYEQTKNWHSTFEIPLSIHFSLAQSSDIPFYDWITEKALMGKTVEKLQRYYEKVQFYDTSYQSFQKLVLEDNPPKTHFRLWGNQR